MFKKILIANDGVGGSRPSHVCGLAGLLIRIRRKHI